MFNTKKINELKGIVEMLSKNIEFLSSKISDLNVNQKHFNAELTLLKQKINPTEQRIAHYTVDAQYFAKSLQRFTKKRSCGGSGGCGNYYQIPCNEIDIMAKKVIEKEPV